MAESSASEHLQLLSGGYVVARALHVVAELGVADILGKTPQTAEALAAAAGAHPEALARVLRLLRAHGVFELEKGRWRHTVASRLLRADHPQSMRAFVQQMGLSPLWTSVGALEHSVRTGEPAGDDVFPGGWWGYLLSNPVAGRIYDASMAAKARGQIAGVLDAYDFSGLTSIADVGGGGGHLLSAVINTTPGATGVLIDLHHVIDAAAAAGLASDRLKLMAGDFFTDDLPACDAYLLMEVIHDWDEERSAMILSSVRRAAPEGARILLIESIVPADPQPDWSKVLDILMLSLFAGKQRTAAEYQHLLEASGFRFEREIPTVGGVSIMEAVAI